MFKVGYIFLAKLIGQILIPYDDWNTTQLSITTLFIICKLVFIVLNYFLEMYLIDYNYVFCVKSISFFFKIYKTALPKIDNLNLSMLIYLEI
jgi:hypothetical protein